MKINNFDSGYYTLKDDEWLKNQRLAGKVLKQAMDEMESAIKPGISTQEVNDIGEKYILSNNDYIPTFKGYMGFPTAVCISVNKELVHGIPKADKIINDGDVVKLDSGVTYKGAIADMARTIAVGNIDNKYKMLIEFCKKSLYDSIEYIGKNIGNIRLGDIGNVIQKSASRINANVIKDLSGHGLEENIPHWAPFIFNYGERKTGIKIRPRMTFCIEPMFVYGNDKIKLQDDKWTITTEDIGVHYEHTIFVHEDHIDIITE